MKNYILWEEVRRIFSDRKLNLTNSTSDPGSWFVFELVYYIVLILTRR